MVRELYELVSGRSWTTVRSCTVEFGPTLAARYPELRRYTDAELMAHGPAILAAVRADRADWSSRVDRADRILRLVGSR